MHYWQFNNADWAQDTSHLTPEEEGIYLRLCRYYYDTESPIPLDTDRVFRRLMITQYQEIALQILEEFFEKSENPNRVGFFHKRIEMEIKKFKKKGKSARENGKKGGRPRKQRAAEETQEKPTGFFSETQQEPTEKLTKNHKPLTTNQEPKEKNTAEPDGSESSVQQVFEYWRFVMDRHNAKLTPTRRRKITARLKMFSVDEIKLAIDGCRRSKFHMGENDTGTIYDDIELICRNDEKIEKFQMVGTGSQEPDYSGFYGLRI